jgi:hypothetical protein
MTYRNVIVCRMVPGSESIVGDVFGHYDRTTRPQDLGVIGRTLLSLDDLYIHVIERNADPAVTGQTRGLPAFQQIAEAIAPYVTPYPKGWQNPSDSVAKEFYRWEPDGGAEDPDGQHLTVVVNRIKPGAEPTVAQVFAESDAGPLPARMGVTGRWLYSIDDVYLHLFTSREAPGEEAMRQSHGELPFAKLIDELSAYLSPYNPETWRSHKDAVARPFYRWRAED